MHKPLHITFLFYEGMTALDAIGPYEVLSRLPEVVVQRVGLNQGPVRTCSGLTLIAEHALTDISHTDVLLIPGAGNATALRECPEILTWIKKIHEHTLWTTSVCTGSLILGAAGVLSGVKATTHWAVMNRLQHWGAIPTPKRFVEDGKIITSAGVSAGIDMAFYLAAKLTNEDIAQSLQLGLEYDPEPPFDSGSPDKAPEVLVQSLRERLKTKFEPEY
ncbi:4-methyl-5(B-hydroxyethyl)-thiazole monophosphate biosynthesis enzyme [Legionella steigerwaltii]|uniref:4-methyl-5(B-hydroxyethyl)-thiazole monophosphate biosynthesis enzyme n=1 Tax=Legionella steigerwaltii TaxID=460 RepID=A0A378LAL5_9GAMM|nr:DJ-1/PfpI family protein [Legionella steigerwaltii]KTD75742.1 4-methyl-5(B-hydroxyethyl)-thiazole monophosphate biosynthesis enzyme [Legionella steigerwaltii]STY23747.1 4-methyl-5(B-hydroxyethyl)-thiazole monophosphate biosynthesis enzyme [Legionella steigerwaltii]